MILIIAGFGNSTSWNEDAELPLGHKLSFTRTLEIVSRDSEYKVLFPRWALNLHPRLRETRDGYDELQTHMMELIEERRRWSKSDDKHDILTKLILASDPDDGDGAALTTAELIAYV